jgi:hypothetical protein
VITNGPSHIFDARRTTRTVTPAQRRVLAVRDRGCVGCQAPLSWCEAHHIVHWFGSVTNRFVQPGTALQPLSPQRARAQMETGPRTPTGGGSYTHPTDDERHSRSGTRSGPKRPERRPESHRDRPTRHRRRPRLRASTETLLSTGL